MGRFSCSLGKAAKKRKKFVYKVSVARLPLTDLFLDLLINFIDLILIIIDFDKIINLILLFLD